jgi:hypothetical protein
LPKWWFLLLRRIGSESAYGDANDLRSDVIEADEVNCVRAEVQWEQRAALPWRVDRQNHGVFGNCLLPLIERAEAVNEAHLKGFLQPLGDLEWVWSARCKG